MLGRFKAGEGFGAFSDASIGLSSKISLPNYTVEKLPGTTSPTVTAEQPARLAALRERNAERPLYNRLRNWFTR